ncbi:MAG: VCBS repeat-containing protein, partial [Planctomycetales bacterium]|nr:VCBS repeat-containing protein [Planctomycetales bacterium]
MQRNLLDACRRLLNWSRPAHRRRLHRSLSPAVERLERICLLSHLDGTWTGTWIGSNVNADISQVIQNDTVTEVSGSGTACGFEDVYGFADLNVPIAGNHIVIPIPADPPLVLGGLIIGDIASDNKTASGSTAYVITPYCTPTGNWTVTRELPTGFVIVTPSTGLTTTEAGGTATFTVRLGNQPTANVTMPISSSDTTEGMLDKATLSFTNSNWNLPQTVTVTGVDDTVADGDVPYTIRVGLTSSADYNYNGLDPADVSVTNTDNEFGVAVRALTSLTTSEAGGKSEFEFSLKSRPTGNVTFGLSSSNPSEGTVLPIALTFTPNNWFVSQKIAVTGVSDAYDDGNIPYQILTSTTSSTDPNYNGLDVPDLSLVNDDAQTLRFFRLFNPHAFTHFFTTSRAEYEAVDAVGWNDEATRNAGFAVSSTNRDQGEIQNNWTPVFRLYNPNSGTHYYTANPDERDALQQLGWRYERDEGFLSTQPGDGLTLVYRLYNRRAGTHLFTANDEERDSVLGLSPDWELHDDLGYAFAVAPSGAIDKTSPTVVSTSPADGSTRDSGPSEILVNFSEPMRQSARNLLPGNLTLGGVGQGSASVTSANWVDADTARFTIAGTWGTGQVTVQMTSGFPEDLAGNSLASYTTGDFTISPPVTTSPTVVSTSPGDGSTLSSGPTEILVNFSEPMRQFAGDLLPSDLTLGGVGRGSTSVTSSNWVDGDTARFTIGGTWGTGQVTVQMTGLWPKNLAGNSLASYTTGDFTISDPVGPAPNFAAKQDFTVGNTPRSVVAADFNGDGKIDVATSNEFSDTISVLQNTTVAGAAIPSFVAKQDFATGRRPRTIAVGDFDGDGKPDLAVANEDANTVSVLRNITASGTAFINFASPVGLATASGPFTVAVGDFNSDNRPDLAVTNADSASVSVLLNTTMAGAASPSFAGKLDITTKGDPRGLAIGDLNGDGHPDLIVSHLFNGLSVLVNTTQTGANTSSFAARQDFSAPASSLAVMLADLNGDDRLDVVSTNPSGVPLGSTSVLFNTTPTNTAIISLAVPRTFSLGDFPVFSAVGDLNRDGKPDIVAANEFGHNVSVLTNQTPRGATTVTVASQQMFDTGTGASAVALADFNGDSRTDLAVTNDGAKTVSILLNTTTSTMVAASRSAQARRADTQTLDSFWSDQVMSQALIDLFAADTRILSRLAQSVGTA